MQVTIPVIAVLGHVDHGKTSLLDKIRSTNFASKEAGGITQSIGASQITTQSGNKITFIDTPGHAVFTAMRSRGAKIADVAILVVAGDDGLKPQTKEALQIIREQEVPFIVAITKSDLPSFNLETTLNSLEKEGVFFEKRGGDIPYLAISSKTGEGIPELLDLVLLVSDVQEKDSTTANALQAFVIETIKDRSGIVVSLIIKAGNLAIGQALFSDDGKVGKVRAIFDQHRKSVKQAVTGDPVQIIGFSEAPKAGSMITDQALDKVFAKDKFMANDDGTAKISVYLKARTAGSLEALIANLPADVRVVGSSVGDIVEGDVLTTKNFGGKYLFAFESHGLSAIKRLADSENIKVYYFDIIYDLIQKIAEIIEEGEVKIAGKAEVLASFPFENKKVAGCKVLHGKISKSDSIILTRNDKEIGKAKIISLRKQKIEVNEVGQGEEFGLIMAPQLDFTMGDVLLSVSSK